MSRVFTSQPITRRTALQAYPLLQATKTQLTLEEWTDFVNRYTAESLEYGGTTPYARRGIIALTNEHGYLNGIFSYEVKEDLHHRHVLHVDNVVVIDILRRHRAAEALLRAIKDVARRHDCTALHAALDDSAPWLKGFFEQLGFGVEKIRYCRPLD